MRFWPDNWAVVLLPQAPVLELIIRISAVYLALVIGLRATVRRQVGRFSLTDLLAIVLLASAVRQGMTGEAWSVCDALILAATLLFWDWFLDFLAIRSRWLRRVVRRRPIPIIRDGVILLEDARDELLTPEEIESQLRLRGVIDLASVRIGYLEPDGRISAICDQPSRMWTTEEDTGT